MTEPRTGPGGDGGQPGGYQPVDSAGAGPAGSTGSGYVPADASSASQDAGGVATTPRTAGGPAPVPQQYTKEQYIRDHTTAQDSYGTGEADEQVSYEEYEQAGYGMREEDEQVVAPVPVVGDTLIARAARMSWGIVALGALCMLAAGVILLVWPHATLMVVAILIGAALVASGLVRIFEGFTARDESGGMRAAYVFIGLLAVIAGIYCLRDHALSILLIAFVTGVYFIMHGIADLAVAASAAVPGRGFRAITGVLSLAAGVIMVVWPGPTLVLLVTIVGAWLLCYGVLLACLAFSLHRFSRSVAARSAPAPRLATSSR